MKKPEFPKPQLIREDFLSEQDPMRNYRIKKVTKGNGEVWYEPQIRYFWFFWTSFADCYGNEQWAQEVILENYQKNQQKVEYLLPDTSKTVPPNPNPPPTVP